MMNAKLSLFSAVVLSVLVGCGSKDSAAPPDLKTCSVGTWIRAERACTCPEGFMFNTSECTATDCTESDALVLREDGTSLDFMFRRSNATNSVSAVGARAGVVDGKWTVSGQELSQTFGTRVHTTDLTCGSNVLTRPGKANYTRASSELGGAFDLAARSSWATVRLRRP